MIEVSKMLTYEDRLKLLHDKKVEHTFKKREQQGYTDADDYGTVPIPDDYHWEPVAYSENGGIYGAMVNAINFASLMDAHPVYVDPLEIMCGRWRKMLTEWREKTGTGTWDKKRFPYDDLIPYQQLYGIIPGIGADSHCAPDFRIGLELGFGGLLKKIADCKAENPGHDEFYDAESICVKAIQRTIDRHIEEIERQLEIEQRAELRETLGMMLEANRSIRDGKPETFLEACQWISWYNVATRIYDRDGAGCQIDVILWPYYEKGIKDGSLNDDLARFILANLLLIETHYYQIAGVDENDRDQTNRVSYLILEAAHLINSAANITIRIHSNVDRELLKKGVQYLFEDKMGWPRFCGDDSLVNGYMRNRGIDKKTARSRIAVGCNWMAIPGREFPMHDCVKINIAKVFEVAYDEMMLDNNHPSTEDLMERFSKHLKIAVEKTAEGINFHLAHQGEIMPELLIDLMMYGCLEKGEDITQCVEIKTIGLDGAGLAVVADSFGALEQRVEKEKVLTWNQVYEAVKSDFTCENGERIRMILSSAPRYCGGDTVSDIWARRLTDVFSDYVTNQPMPEGRQLVPGWFSWSNTIMFGEMVGATPNGRHARKPISHGANPNTGFRKDGAVTAQANGIAKVQPGYGATAPLQLEFDPKMTIEEGGVERVLDIIETHCQMGGTLININILDGDKLMAANENPDLYPDLVVRVTGFTAYFISLSPEFRQLVVDRFLSGM